MELYKAKADRLNLAHQLRGVREEDASRLRSKKRSYEELESMLDAEHRECLRLQRVEASYQKKIRDLEKQLRDKDIQLKKEVDLRQASENHLGGEVFDFCLNSLPCRAYRKMQHKRHPNIYFQTTCNRNLSKFKV